ncbi:hypothetical protein Tco_1232214, partial [Tanacetum coccineum]
PADGVDDKDDEDEPSDDDKDDDMDIEADDEEEEEHPAPADSIVVALPATDQAPSAEETEPFETDESAATPPPHPAYRVTARISIPAPVPTPVWSDAEIPSPSLPLSPPSPVLSPAPPPSPIRSLGYRAAMIRMRAEAASTCHSLLLLPPFILSPTRLDAPSLGILPPLSISVPTSSPPLLLPSVSRREDRPEVTLPPRKRLGIALGPGYKIRRDPEREGQHMTALRLWVRQTQNEIYTRRLDCPERLGERIEDAERTDCDHTIGTAVIQTGMADEAYTWEYGCRKTGSWLNGTIFRISNCSMENQIKFSTCTLLAGALTWWNSHVITVSHDVAYAMTWAIQKEND